MDLITTFKKQFTVRKLLFNTLFWGAHWAAFAYGW
jgi:hypothetical protein